MADQMKCPKCGGEMEKGFIPEINSAGNYSTQVWGTGISGGLATKINNSHNVFTYRCTSCGYLESYAK